MRSQTTINHLEKRAESTSPETKSLHPPISPNNEQTLILDSPRREQRNWSRFARVPRSINPLLFFQVDGDAFSAGPLGSNQKTSNQKTCSAETGFSDQFLIPVCTAIGAYRSINEIENKFAPKKFCWTSREVAEEERTEKGKCGRERQSGRRGRNAPTPTSSFPCFTLTTTTAAAAPS